MVLVLEIANLFSLRLLLVYPTSIHTKASFFLELLLALFLFSGSYFPALTSFVKAFLGKIFHLSDI